jgi:GTP-binding protein
LKVLINQYVDKPQKLAKTSRPGTQLINHFLINNNWFLVDLPGYGYAKVSKKPSPFSAIYYGLFRNPWAISLCICFNRYSTWGTGNWPRIHVVHGRKQILLHHFYKTDKISRVKIDSHIAAYKKNMLANNWAEMLIILWHQLQNLSEKRSSLAI